MPALKNAQHEAFCRNIAHKQMRILQAYKAAGYRGDKGNATRLSQRSQIVARIAELQEALAEKSGWDATKRLKMLEDMAATNQRKDPRVTLGAISEANRMQGSYAPTKQEHTGKDGGPIQFFDLSKVTDEDLDKLEAILGPLAAAGDDADPDQSGARTTEG